MGKALQIRQKAADSPQGLTARRWPALLALAQIVCLALCLLALVVLALCFLMASYPEECRQFWRMLRETRAEGRGNDS